MIAPSPLVDGVPPPEPAADADLPMQAHRARRIFRDFVRQPAALIAALWILLMIAVSVYVGVFKPLQPDLQDLVNRLQGPSRAHIFGVDSLGRDVFARILYATRIAMQAVAQGVAIAALLGVVPGLIAGFKGGRVGMALTAVADGLIVFPGLILALAIVGVLGPGLTNAMIAVGVSLSPGMFRVVRAAALSVKSAPYVDAARTMGATNTQIIARHVLPNIISPLLVQLSLAASSVLLAEAGLSFLGLGVQPPQASWGSMIRDAQRYMTDTPWIAVFPGGAITLAAISFNMVSDGLSRAMARRGTARDE